MAAESGSRPPKIDYRPWRGEQRVPSLMPTMFAAVVDRLLDSMNRSADGLVFQQLHSVIVSLFVASNIFRVLLPEVVGLPGDARRLGRHIYQATVPEGF